MGQVKHRETFIALRATRQAHRVASDVLNPHLDVPEFQRDARNADEIQTEQFIPSAPQTCSSSIFDSIVTVVALVIFFAFLVLLFCIGR